MSIGNNDPSAVATRDLRHVLAQAAFLQERLPPLEASIRTLIAEVNELRAENLNLRERLEVRTQHGHNLRTMLESATETERAAVVMYLYKRGGICIDVADDIGRGLHIREEEP